MKPLILWLSELIFSILVVFILRRVQMTALLFIFGRKRISVNDDLEVESVFVLKAFRRSASERLMEIVQTYT